MLKHLPKAHQATLVLLFAFLGGLVIYQNLPPHDVALPSEQQQAEAAESVLPDHRTAENQQNTRLELEVKNGDTLSSIFKKAGLSAQEVDAIMGSNKDAKVLKSLFPGNRLTFDLDADHDLTSLEVSKSAIESYQFVRNDNGSYDFHHQLRAPDIKLVVRQAEISDSLFMAAQRSGIPAAMTMELTGIFGGVIDFILDTREGDTFKVLFEEQYLDGNRIGFGKILAAEFVNQGKTFTAIRYEDTSGNVNFYSPAGESMRKAFLLNPVDFTRISSGFSLARKHPILNTIRAHKGTDYAAPQGTPVVATSDGRITYAGYNGSFGKLIVIQHSERYVTKYAHLSNFSRLAKQGSRVRQGDVIGYVGATGAATGPHLHYEFLVDGIHRDSRKIYDKLPRAESLPPREMALFKKQVDQLLAQLDSDHSPGAIVAAAPDSRADKQGVIQ
ncbi:MAG TPA: peptidoglycan DD-metalloendopeptidase family protein [Candidatus Acidoferrum sp.]|nr:peptidoglycan DD-metalloendopeptidase family protein [Candidatus Acidoferrum sp.]